MNIYKYLFNVNLIGILFFSYLGLISIKTNTENKEFFNKSPIIKVLIIDAPRHCNSINNTTSTVVLKYNGKIFNNKMGAKYCDEIIGKKYVNMKTNQDNSKLFFLSDKSSFDNQIGFGYLFCGVVIFFLARFIFKLF